MNTNTKTMEYEDVEVTGHSGGKWTVNFTRHSVFVMEGARIFVESDRAVDIKFRGSITGKMRDLYDSNSCLCTDCKALIEEITAAVGAWLLETEVGVV